MSNKENDFTSPLESVETRILRENRNNRKLKFLCELIETEDGAQHFKLYNGCSGLQYELRDDDEKEKKIIEDKFNDFFYETFKTLQPETIKEKDERNNKCFI